MVTRKPLRWEPEVANDLDMDALMNAAVQALEEEDQELAKVLTNGAQRSGRAFHSAFSNVGRGLSYWLYETTIVYLIWKRWVRNGTAVAWDWTAAELKRARRLREPGISGKQRIDLVVFGARDKIDAAFEASWWTTDSQKTRTKLRADAKKLRGVAAKRRYLLVFWFERKGDAQEEAEKVRKFCRTNRLVLVGLGRFPAAFRDGRKAASTIDGNFTTALLKVEN